MKKILVIEDDRVMGENISELLELTGYKVKWAENGKKGIFAAREWLPDLIVCDIMMPELNGYGVLYALEKNPDTAGIPFLFLTAKSSSEDRRKGMQMGADDFLTKPFQDTDLLTAIEVRLKRREAILERYSAPGLSDSTSTSLTELAGASSPDLFQKGHQLYRQGDQPAFLYYLHSGKVKTFRLDENGKELITNLAGPGEIVGYQALLEDRPYLEFAKTLEDSQVSRIPRDRFLELIYGNREAAATFIQELSRRLTDRGSNLMAMAYHSVRKRLAEKLLELIPEHNSSPISISRADLAKLTGTTKESLVRALTDMRKAGLVEADGDSISLPNRDELVKNAQNW